MGKTDPGSKIAVIADAGPLIHLDELGSLSVLADFRQVWVPDAVWSEVEQHRPDALKGMASVLMRLGVPPEAAIIDALASTYTLHCGEREALAWCFTKPPSLLLTDDTAARMAAKSLGISVHGTIGLLIRAIRCQLLTKEQVLRILSDIPNRSSLHIRPAFLAGIIGEVEEKA